MNKYQKEWERYAFLIDAEAGAAGCMISRGLDSAKSELTKAWTKVIDYNIDQVLSWLEMTPEEFQQQYVLVIMGESFEVVGRQLKLHRLWRFDPIWQHPRLTPRKKTQQNGGAS